MWRLVLAVSLLCCSAEASVSCKNETGAEVDWYILYKNPKNQQKHLSGEDYVYIYPDSHGKVQSETKSNIKATTGILANTLRQHLDFKKKSPPKDFGFISYNDQPPKVNNKKPSVSSEYGHSKGVVMVEKNKKGLWLLHSTPGFPKIGQSFYPTSGIEKAQTFICVTLDYNQFTTIGTHLQYINAFRYYEHIPSDFHNELKKPTAEAGPSSVKKPKTDNVPHSQSFKLNSKEFKVIAKAVSEQGKAEDGDLYVAISKEIDSDVKVQTWCSQGNNADSSFCPKSGKKVLNILSVKPHNNWEGWEPGNDHSKWCVAVDQPWTCIADVNRAESQYRRPGGALCVNDADIAKLFRGFIDSVDNCLAPVKKGGVVCSDPGSD